MAGRIPQAFIDDLIARADIVEVIGSRVPLKKAGREYKACCPFHDEKTPSFWVSPDKQFYHCFGCSAHGTALGFLMQYDQLPFPEAVEELAGRLGLSVPHEGGSAASAVDEFAPLYTSMAAVAEFFADTLTRSERASDYARKRGLTATTLKDFQIGYAPEGWDELLRRFGSSAQGRQVLSACGLIIEREAGSGRSGHYDRFRGRLMFPIRDNRGRVIAFGGRVIDQGEPKYLNSPETPLFHKGRELYGLYETRLARVTLKRLLVVEGYMDVVQLHQAGIRYAVATLGTATTAEHLHRAFRLVSEVVFAFDGDRAGRAAAWRALQNALPEARAGRQIRFLFLPDGEDPDSLALREGGEAFEARVAAALPLSEYLVAHLREDTDLSHADGRARFIAAARPLLEKVEVGVYRELLLERVAAEIGWSAERLTDAFAGGNPLLPTGNAGDRFASAAVGRPHGRRSGRGGLVTQAIQLLLHYPQAHAGVGGDAAGALAAVEAPGTGVLRTLLEELQLQPVASTAQILERWRDRPEYRRLCELAAEPILIEPTAATRELTDAVQRLIDGVGEERLSAWGRVSGGGGLQAPLDRAAGPR